MRVRSGGCGGSGIAPAAAPVYQSVCRTYEASCKPDGESQECMDFLWTKYPGQDATRWSAGGTKNQTELLNKVLKLAGPSPHQVTLVHEIEQMQKDTGDHFMAVGFFDKCVRWLRCRHLTTVMHSGRSTLSRQPHTSKSPTRQDARR